MRWLIIAAALTFSAPAQAADPDLHCLALAVYHEARGEPYEGQLAVAHVVLNRVEDHRFPDDACAVIKQPRAFPWFRRRAHSPIRDIRSFTNAREVAARAIQDRDGDPTFGALCFDHRRRPSPCAGARPVRVIGGHRFYALD